MATTILHNLIGKECKIVNLATLFQQKLNIVLFDHRICHFWLLENCFVVCATWTQFLIFLAGVFLMVTFSIQCCATPEKNIQYESVLHVNNILQSILEHPLGNTTSKTKIINSASLWKVSCFIYSVLKNWGINIWISRIDWTLPCCYGNSKIVTKITWGSIYFN